MLAFMWAEDQNHLIGQAGHLPWSLPADLANFKRETLTGTVVMGRKTYESLPKRPLPQRPNVVLTRQENYAVAPGVTVYSAVKPFLELAAQQPETNFFIIGGAAIFAALAAQVDYLYVTRIHAQFKGDVYMPPLDWSAFELIQQRAGQVDARNRYAHDFEVYRRR